MAKGKKGKKKLGRPASYDSDYHLVVGRKLALLGMTDEEIGGHFGKTPQTICRWKKQYPEFRDALEKGGERASAKVATRLFERAIGYSHPDYQISTHKVKKTSTDKKGNKTTEEEIKVVEVPYTKHYPPDVGAAVFWLVNRTRHMVNPWRNTRGVEHSGRDGNPIQTEDVSGPIDLADLSEEELEMAEKIGLAASKKRKNKEQKNKNKPAKRPREELFD